MAEQNTRTHKPFEGKISEETREHFRAAREEFQKSMAGIIPPGFIEHRQKARKEMLLAGRSILDALLERMDEKKKK
jgi:hypothetical protein